jgi:hypothetical protein
MAVGMDFVPDGKEESAGAAVGWTINAGTVLMVDAAEVGLPVFELVCLTKLQLIRDKEINRPREISLIESFMARS